MAIENGDMGVLSTLFDANPSSSAWRGMTRMATTWDATSAAACSVENSTHDVRCYPCDEDRRTT